MFNYIDYSEELFCELKTIEIDAIVFILRIMQKIFVANVRKPLNFISNSNSIKPPEMKNLLGRCCARIIIFGIIVVKTSQ